MKRIKPITDKVVNKQDIKSITIDVDAEFASVVVELSRHTAMPADANQPAPYTRIDNVTTSTIVLTKAEIDPALNNLITKIDTLV